LLALLRIYQRDYGRPSDPPVPKPKAP
jgi:hypothetical protein